MAWIALALAAVEERAGRDRRHLGTFKVLTFLMPGVRDVRRNAGFWWLKGRKNRPDSAKAAQKTDRGALIQPSRAKLLQMQVAF